MLCLFRARTRHVLSTLFISLSVANGLAEEVATSGAGEAAFTSAVFDDWTLKCVVPAKAPTPTPSNKLEQLCEIFQSVAVEDQGQPVEIMSLAVSPLPKAQGKARYTLVGLVPLDVHLPSDFGLSAGGTELALARYRNCDKRGCFVFVSLSDKAIKRLKRAMDGGAHFTDLAGRSIKVVFSLKGFTKAFESLAAGVVPAPGGASETPGEGSP